jgi:predicted dehydrogenase
MTMTAGNHPAPEIRKLRWGVMSTANIGRGAVNPAIQASSNGTLDAVASRDGTRARSFADAAGISRHYGSYEALLDDRDIDAVYIPLPNGGHAEWTIRAAERGKHVLCEKPFALSVEQCDRMERAAKANGVKLMEAFMYRFHPRTERAISLVLGGALGTIRSIRSAFTFRLARPGDVRWDPEQGGGALWDVGCYCVSVSRTMANAEPAEVQAWASWSDRGVDTRLNGVMHFPNGVIAHFDCALDMERREFYDVGGTDSSITVESGFTPGKADAAIIEHRANREHVQHEIAGADQYRFMVEHFADCALNNRQVRYPAAEARANVAVIAALYESARNGGRPVQPAPHRGAHNLE